MELGENLNITLFEYLNTDRYDIAAIIQHSEMFKEKKDKYNIGTFEFWTCGDVKECIEMFSNNQLKDILSISKVYFSLADKKEDDLMVEPILDVHRMVNFFIDQIQKVIALERNTLYLEPEGFELACGIEMFNELGYHSQILSLAGDDITKYESIRQQPYWLFYKAMRKSILTSIYQKNIREWQRQKNTN